METDTQNPNAPTRKIYCDYAAATPVDDAVLLAMQPFYTKKIGNPGSLHRLGVEAKVAIEDAREEVAFATGSHSDEIFFTSSGTEACNLAIFGSIASWRNANPNKIPHVITSALEHAAVLEPLQHLAVDGRISLTVLPVNEQGIVSLKGFKELLSSDTALVAIMLANNEIGTIQPVREIAKVVRDWKKAKQAEQEKKNDGKISLWPLVFTDACQAPVYLELHLPRLGVDLIALNGAKVYGPKGVGALVVRRGVTLEPVIYGGGQEKGMRSGTENVPAIVGMGKAFALLSTRREPDALFVVTVRDALWAKIHEEFPEAHLNGALSPLARLPNNLNITIPNVDHEYVVLSLDAKGIYIATKSACRTNDDGESHVLKALRDGGDGSSLPPLGIRISLGRGNNMEDVEPILSGIREAIKLARASVTTRPS